MICHAIVNRYGKEKQGSAISDRRRREIELYQSKRATLLHLLDLKRGGYSPTRTEFNIPPDSDRMLPTRGFIEYASFCGSSSALCAVHGPADM